MKIIFINFEEKFPLKMKSENKSIELTISGMTCKNCENMLRSILEEKKGIYKVEASAMKNSAKILFDSNEISIPEIKKTIIEETTFKLS